MIKFSGVQVHPWPCWWSGTFTPDAESALIPVSQDTAVLAETSVTITDGKGTSVFSASRLPFQSTCAHLCVCVCSCMYWRETGLVPRSSYEYGGVAFSCRIEVGFMCGYWSRYMSTCPTSFESLLVFIPKYGYSM